MGLPTVEKFFCCLELKTGALIVGILNLIGVIILAIVSLVGLAAVSFVASGVFGGQAETYSDIDSQLREVYKKQGIEYPGNAGGDAADTGAVVDAALAWSIAVMAITLIICVLYVVIASLLIHGARKEKPGLLMPWLMLTVFSLVWNIIQLIGNFVSGSSIVSGVGGLIGLGLGIYVFICIWSFRKQLLEEQSSVRKT